MTGHVHDLLAYYRELEPEERRRVAAHLMGCAECRAAQAAYEAQEAALRALPHIAPSRDLRPRVEAWPTRALGLMGRATALTGMFALLWLFALQVQTLSQGGPQPANLVVEPGIALPPTRVAVPSPWLPALPWVGGALLTVGGLFILSRRSWLATLLGAAAAGLLLISFIPPLSMVPNPAALYWRAAGGYSYDPRLPFKNSTLILGRPEQELRPRLDALIGLTGLAPLDPLQPLARYEILEVGLHPVKRRVALVTTRFIYADGTSRVYPVPLIGPGLDLAGFYLAGWREDGLQRLRSEHLAFPEQPFAGPDSAIQVGPVRRLDLHPRTSRLDEANPSHWLWNSVRLQRLVAAPDGRALLLAVEVDAGLRELWLAPLDERPPTRLAVADIREYGWSPDGQVIVYTRFDPAAAEASPSAPYAAVAVSAAGASARDSGRVLATGLASDQLPGLTGDGAWFFFDGVLWVAPYAGGAPQARAVDLPAAPLDAAPRPTADGTRVAFACARGLCLIDSDGQNAAIVGGLAPSVMRWSPDRARLAVVDRDPNNLRPLKLVIVTRDGTVLLEREIAPRDVADPPLWTADGRAILIQTFPQDGRRIIAVHLPTGAVTDLSREHWDAYFTLMPGDAGLLLNNGRGDFWQAGLLIDD